MNTVYRCVSAPAEQLRFCVGWNYPAEKDEGVDVITDNAGRRYLIDKSNARVMVPGMNPHRREPVFFRVVTWSGDLKQ